MKVVLNKKAFTLDETELIKQFKAEWYTPTTSEIESAISIVATHLGIRSAQLDAVLEIELTKNRFKPTYWITALVWGRDENATDLYAKMGFDYVQAIMANHGDKVDNYTEIYKRV